MRTSNVGLVPLLLTLCGVSTLPVAAVARPLFPAQQIASAATIGNAGKGDLAVASTGNQDYGSAYTPEMLAAVDQALHAINCSRADLMFEKDYGKGHACFPAVREMLRDPLAIAPFVERHAYNSALAHLWALLAASPELGLDDAFESIPDAQRMRGAELNGLPTAPAYAAELLEYLHENWTTRLGVRSEPELADESFRAWLLSAMAWHPLDPGGAAQAQAPDEPSAALYARAEALDLLYGQRWNLLCLQSFAEEVQMRRSFYHEMTWPESAPLIIETSAGRVGIGTLGDDYYTGNFSVLIEPGGNDTYHNCRIGAAYGKPAPGLGDGRLACFLDMGGDDLYDCADVDVTLGAAVLGCAVFYDVGSGNDRYYAGSCSLGAAMGGAATFYDDGGSDSYSGKVFTQGAAGFGIGVMVDDSAQPAPNAPTDAETPDPIDIGAFDNDTYTAWSSAQAFARTRGIAVCANQRGNETYHAGGVYLHAPLFTDRYQSFSQGFAIGERDIDYAGGIALLADYAGNDRYLGDIYNQGVGYWYSAGLLYDGGGNDTYEMTQYGQGSGIHLAVGGLIDVSGHDTYVMHSGLGQGSSHDYATSILLDRAGNDKYYGTTTSCGASLTNSACLFIDCAGDDTYAARSEGGLNYGRPARDAGSIGLFIDMAGKDDYLGAGMADSTSWTSTQYGSGVDIDPAAATLLSPDSGAQSSAPANNAPDSVGRASAPAEKDAATEGRATDQTVIPEIVSYAGPLTQEVFDQLWEIAIRWEVGDNQLIVPKARQRLIAFGPDVLPYVEAKMDNPGSLAVRAYVEILKSFAWQPPVAQASLPANQNEKAAGVQHAAPPQPAETLPLVEALLARQFASGEEARQIAALSVAGELATPEAGAAVALLLDSTDMGLQRRALSTLGLLGGHSADARIIALLHPDTDERLLRAAIATAGRLRLDCYPQFRALLDVPKFTARDALLGQLATQYETYGPALRADFITAEGLSPTAQRMVLRVQLAVKQKPDAALVDALWSYTASDDWGVRADAVELVMLWTPLCHDDPELDPLFTGNTGLQREISNMRESLAQPWPVRN